MVAESSVPSDRPSGGWRLKEAASSYLRSASEQPIEWYPWGQEAFELARRSGRPLLLDVGASWCHWCHVMDEGTYSDPEVARLLRQHFVAVKVDRDEHPEIDRRYQREVGALTGEGGWPLTAFLTPDGSAFLGGTYFPAQDGLGRPGFRRVLKQVADLWKDEPEKIRGNVDAVKDALKRMSTAEAARPQPVAAFVEAVRASLYQSYDPVHAGFGMAPKFPHPTAVSFLLWDSFAAGNEESAARARETLIRMADGGMYDQVGGGFHRYSVDEGWHIPHFEKMGADNAALLSAYAEGARRFDDPRLERTLRGTLAWIRAVLGDPAGGFGASQDADNAPGDDGSYFTWSRPELKAVLDADELRLVGRVFGVGSDGRMPHDPDRNVLFRLMSPAEATEGTSASPEGATETLDGAVAKLVAARGQRHAPAVDPALYANLNGGFLRALVAAGTWLDDASVIADARKAADRFLAHAYDPRRGIAHRLDADRATGFGLLDDNAEFAWGLVELAGATVEPRYLQRAEALLNLIDLEFRGQDGLLRDLAPSLYDGPTIGAIPEPSYPLEDNPHLSANAAAALAFLRFGSVTGRAEWGEKARALVTPMQQRIGRAGLFAAGAALAAGLLDTPAARIVVEGRGPAADALYRAARAAWHPNLWVFRGVPPEPFSSPEEVRAAAGEDRGTRALVCFGTRCLAPITDPSALAPVLLSGGRASAG